MGIRAQQKEKTRRSVIDAAFSQLNAERSFSNLSLREVAREAGIAPTSFYRHFRDMDELGLTMVDEGGLMLVDFKLEFGVFKDRIVLGDEFSPDGCRVWDKETKKKLDKDRFRQSLGDVIEGYEEVAQRIGVPMPE